MNADGSGVAGLTQEGLNKNSADRVQMEQTHRWPSFLPNGNHFLYWAGNFGNSKDDRFSGIYLSSLDERSARLVVLCRSSFGYDSQNLYFADSQRRLVRMPFDLSCAKISGAAVAVADAVGLQPSTYRAALTVAASGTVIYSTGVGAALFGPHLG